MSVYLDDGDVVLHLGDVLDVLRAMPDGSVDCCVTSPPYFGLRDYGVEGQIGLEPTPDEFIARLVGVFAEVRRVLAVHGSCWVNIGDSYAAQGGAHGGRDDNQRGVGAKRLHDEGAGDQELRRPPNGMKPKDLLMMPARVALALQADGWWLRKDIIWAKPNPMPESVTDRPTSAHEHVFLLTKAPRYYYDAEAVREAMKPETAARGKYGFKPGAHDEHNNYGDGFRHSNGKPVEFNPGGRNMRDVWTISTEPTPEAHFATFPTELVRRCLAAGCAKRVCAACGVPRRRIVDRDLVATRGKVGDHQGEGRSDRMDAGSSFTWNGGVYGHYETTTTGWTDCGHDVYRPGVCLDPFIGSGTTAKVARAMGLRAVGIELNAEYLAIAAKRLQQLSLLGGGT